LHFKRLLRGYAIPCFISASVIASAGVASLATMNDDRGTPVVSAAEEHSEQEQRWAALPAIERRSPSPTATPVVPPAPAGESGEPPPVTSPEPAPPSDAPETDEPEGDEPAPESTRQPSMFDENQLVVYYGTPLAPGLGVLGMHPPQEMAQRLKEHTRLYDDLNGDRKAVGTMDLIYGVVQAEPTANNLYLSYLSDEKVNEYIRLRKSMTCS
jgi:hypothetical protein